jgi:F420-non-reducing hydrogenase iron-sulfur subunit
MSAFVPRIVAFCCEESGYPAADMAGVLRRTVPGDVDIVRVPCAGRIGSDLLLKALERGADAVLIFACHEDNCPSLLGNLRLKGRLSYARRLLEKVGLEKERLEVCPLAVNNGAKFAEVLQEKVQQLQKLGRNPAMTGKV